MLSAEYDTNPHTTDDFHRSLAKENNVSFHQVKQFMKNQPTARRKTASRRLEKELASAEPQLPIFDDSSIPTETTSTASSRKTGGAGKGAEKKDPERFFGCYFV